MVITDPQEIERLELRRKNLKGEEKWAREFVVQKAKLLIEAIERGDALSDPHVSATAHQIQLTVEPYYQVSLQVTKEEFAERLASVNMKNMKERFAGKIVDSEKVDFTMDEWEQGR